MSFARAPSRQVSPRPTAEPDGADPLIGDLRRGGLLPLLVLHYVAGAPCYGSQLRDRIGERDRLSSELDVRLDRIARSIEAIRAELAEPAPR